MDKKSHFKPPQRKSEERVLAQETVEIERKSFVVERRENARGEFLKLTETQGNRRACVIIPMSGVGGLVEAISKVA